MKQSYREDRLLAGAFLAPTFLLIIAVTAIPVVMAFYTSLQTTYYANIVGFAGLSNYKDILLSSEGWLRIFNSVLYVVASLVLVMPLGVGAAILLNRNIRLRAVFRTVIIIPWVLSQTVVALLWKWLLNANFGPIVYVATRILGQRIDFFNTAAMARFTVSLSNTWYSFPIAVLLTLAALQTIPQELYEAARVDGASDGMSLRRITLPLIFPTVVTTVVMLSIEYFNMVTLIYVMTSGGPFSATETMSVKAFKEGFDYWHMDLGSAYSVLIFLLNIVFSLLYVRLLRRRDQR
jgi:ABC-type sugar transport system permease subunit